MFAYAVGHQPTCEQQTAPATAPKRNDAPMSLRKKSRIPDSAFAVVPLPPNIPMDKDARLAVADQIDKIGVRWHAVGLEVAKLASMMDLNDV